MTDSTPPIKAANDTEVAEILAMCERIRAAAMEGVEPDTFGPRASLAMTAAALTAGAIYGQAIALGVEPSPNPKRVREACEMVERNFRNGMEVGRRRCESLIAATGNARSETVQ